METVRDIVVALLRDFGVTSLDPDDNASNRGAAGLKEGMVAECIAAINGAFQQEIYRRAPSAFTELPFAEVLQPPTDITFSGTQYSKTISAFATWANWMKGCTVQIAGETVDNYLVSATELGRPLMGATGAKSARVYSDALALPSTYGHIIEPIRLLGEQQLHVATSREEFLNYSYAGSTVGTHFPDALAGYAPKPDGIPRMVFVDTRRDATSAFLPTFLRISPMPSQAFLLEFTVKLKPPTYTTADVDNGDHTTDPGTVIPLDWIESILYPLARQRLTSSADFSNEDGKPEIRRQFEEAISALENSNPSTFSQCGGYPAPAGGGR